MHKYKCTGCHQVVELSTKVIYIKSGLSDQSPIPNRLELGCGFCEDRKPFALFIPKA
jgi:hypothetical protein